MQIPLSQLSNHISVEVKNDQGKNMKKNLETILRFLQQITKDELNHNLKPAHKIHPQTEFYLNLIPPPEQHMTSSLVIEFGIAAQTIHTVIQGPSEYTTEYHKNSLVIYIKSTASESNETKITIQIPSQIHLKLLWLRNLLELEDVTNI